MKISNIKLSLVALILLFTSVSKAQYFFEYGGGLGISNYLGDIGGKEKTRRDFIADLKLAKTRWDVNGFVRYKLPMFQAVSVKGTLTYLRITGDDKLSINPGRNARNLNFRNDMFELAANAQWNFYHNTDLGKSYMFRIAFTSYVFAGVSGFYSNPKALYNGSYVKLRPLTTEGVEYKPIGLALPVGMGFTFTLKKRHKISWELNWRTTFTDYLDDISTVYADPSTLSAEAIPLANRTNEVAANYSYGFLQNFKAGAKRGDPTHNDSYLSMNVTYSYTLRSKGSFRHSKYGSFFNKKRRRGKGRAIRSKF